MPKYDLDNNIILSKGTIIHGISDYDENKIENISKTGILTGQAVGKLEDGETYYCADFHRVKENTKIDDYSLNFKYNDGRCPFGNNIKIDNANSLAFIIVPNEFNKDLLAYDCYRKGTREADITKGYITSMPLEEGVGSSILYGVPSSCFDGIVVGGKILEDNSKIKFLIDKFPNCYITSSYGELIYEPNKKDIYSEEIVNIKRENALLRRNNRLLKYRISVLTEDKKIKKIIIIFGGIVY